MNVWEELEKLIKNRLGQYKAAVLAREDDPDEFRENDPAARAEDFARYLLETHVCCDDCGDPNCY